MLISSCSIPIRLEGYKKKLAHVEAVFAESKAAGKPEGARLTMRTGFLGLVVSKVDTSNHCNEKIKELVPKLDAEQKISLQDRQQRAALIFFNSCRCWYRVLSNG
ncbi:CSC1-like protein ERD4 isoform X2 [Carex rostrata]